MWLIIALGLVPMVLVCVFRNTKYYKLASSLPQAKALPLIGHAYTMWVDKDEMLEKILEIVGDEENDKILLTKGLLAFWIGPMLVVGIDNLDDIQQVMSSREIIAKGFHYKFMEPYLGQGLITYKGEHWSSHRKLLTPAFHYSMLEKFIPVFNSNTEMFLKKLGENAGKGEIDIENYVPYLTLDIIAETALSTKVDAQIENSKYAHMMKDILAIIATRAFKVLYYFDFVFNRSSIGKRHNQNIEYLNDFVNNFINIKKKEKESIDVIQNESNMIGSKTRAALLDLLLDTQKKNPLLTDKDILDETNTFMVAGHDTVTSGINFTLYLLSRHQSIQDEVLKETLSVVGEDEFTYSNLQELKYLDRVIKESLRILPSVPFIIRAVEKDTKLKSGYVLPAGASIFLFLYRLHRDPRIYSEPEKFDPDRFLPENIAKKHPYAYLPFSSGPRNCIGQKFAMLEMKAVIAATVRRFKLLPSEEDIKLVANVVLKSANGVKLKLEERNINRQ